MNVHDGYAVASIIRDQDAAQPITHAIMLPLYFISAIRDLLLVAAWGTAALIVALRRFQWLPFGH